MSLKYKRALNCHVIAIHAKNTSEDISVETKPKSSVSKYKGKVKGKGKRSIRVESNESNLSTGTEVQNNPVGLRSQCKDKPVDRSDYFT